MLKTAANPGGLPVEVFDKIRIGFLADMHKEKLNADWLAFLRAGDRFAGVA
jgi:hypothetical protein